MSRDVALGSCYNHSMHCVISGAGFLLAADGETKRHRRLGGDLTYRSDIDDSVRDSQSRYLDRLELGCGDTTNAVK